MFRANRRFRNRRLLLAGWRSANFGRPDLSRRRQRRRARFLPASERWFRPGNPPFDFPAVPPDNQPAPFAPSYTGGNWWEYSGGWCLVAAFVDDFYVLNTLS